MAPRNIAIHTNLYQYISTLSTLMIKSNVDCIPGHGYYSTPQHGQLFRLTYATCIYTACCVQKTKERNSSNNAAVASSSDRSSPRAARSYRSCDDVRTQEGCLILHIYVVSTQLNGRRVYRPLARCKIRENF